MYAKALCGGMCGCSGISAGLISFTMCWKFPQPIPNTGYVFRASHAMMRCWTLRMSVAESSSSVIRVLTRSTTGNWATPAIGTTITARTSSVGTSRRLWRRYQTRAMRLTAVPAQTERVSVSTTTAVQIIAPSVASTCFVLDSFIAST